MNAQSPVGTLKVSTAPIDVEIVSEPKVILTFRGYAPVLEVRVSPSGLVKQLYIAAKSIATPLEALRISNAGLFVGLRLRIRKETNEQMAPYVVERLP